MLDCELEFDSTDVLPEEIRKKKIYGECLE